MNFLKLAPFPLICFLAFSIAPFLPRAAAQPQYTDPVLPPIDYHAEAFGTLGRWSIYSPTIPGWHYSLEQLGADGQSWEALPDGQFYGNGQQLKYFVTEGRLPNNPGNAPPPPAGTPAWQISFISFTLTAQKNGLSSKFRLQREPTIGAVPTPGWTVTLNDLPNEPEALPAMPTGNRTYHLQGWEDSFAKIRWNMEIKVIVNENAPPDSYSGNPSQIDTEKIVFNNVKWQLIGAITTPYTPGPPLVAGPKQIIRLRRTALDTNNNGIPNWWELANKFPDLTAFNAAADDWDGDGLSTLLEYQMGTNPTVSDTDGDGLSDGAETTAGSDPLHFNMPTFTLVSAWRKVELTETITRTPPLPSSRMASAARSGSGNGTGPPPASNAFSPSLTGEPFPLPLTITADSAWNTSPPIPMPIQPVGIHDMGIPLYSFRTDHLHGDGSFINMTLNTNNVNLNVEQFSTINRTAIILERTVRVKASRSMPVSWNIPYSLRASSKASRTAQWSVPSVTAGNFTFSPGQTFSSEVTLGRGNDPTPTPPIRTRLNTTSVWNDPIFTTEAEAIEWLTVDQFSTSSTNLAYDNDQDGVSNELELKMGTNPTQRNSDGSGYADGDQLNQGVLPPPDGLVMTTRQTEYQYSPEDLKCPGHPANRLAIETDIPVVNYVKDPYGAKLDIDVGLQGALALNGQFPNSAPVGSPMPLPGADAQATARKPKSEMQYTLSGTTAAAIGKQRRIWGYTAELPTANFSRPYLKIRTEQQGTAAATITTEVINLDFTPASKTSTNYVDLLAKRPAVNVQDTKVTEEVLQVDIEPDASMAGVVGDVVKSAKTGSSVEHFVTPKKSTELNQEYVVLKAVGVTSEQITDGNANQIVQWDRDGGLPTDPPDPLKRRVKRDATGTGPTEVKIKAKQGGAVAAQMNVWVVWGGAGRFERKPTQPSFSVTSRQNIAGDSSNAVNVEPDRPWLMVFAIEPKSMFDKTAEVPDLMGTVQPSGITGNHPILNNGHATLDGGANRHWDVSRQFKETITNNGGIAKGLFPDGAGALYANQPKANQADVAVNFPTDPITGNDDTNVTDEHNDPYNPKSIPIFGGGIYQSKQGEVLSQDSPKLFMTIKGMKAGEGVTDYAEFKEFVRLNLGGKWFQASDLLDFNIKLQFTMDADLQNVTPTGSDVSPK